MSQSEKSAFKNILGQRIALDPAAASVITEVPAEKDEKGKETAPAKFIFYIDGVAHHVLAEDEKLEDLADLEPPPKKPSPAAQTK